MKIDGEKIESLVKEAGADISSAPAILDKAAEAKGLTLEEAAILLSIEDPALLQALYKKAGEVKEKIFGKRVVLFAPLYLSNYCANGCLYCGFRSANRDVERTALTPQDAVREAQTLEKMGFKRVLLVTGEDRRWGLDYIISCVKAIYRDTGMRIVHVNGPPMDDSEFRELKASGAGVYQAFQETYHRPTYEKMHPTGRKKDYRYRLDVMDRAAAAGFDDVGIGALLGLYDYRFDCVAAIAHSRHLYDEFGAHAHTISIPRLRPAQSGLEGIPHAVTDDDVKKITAVYRLSVPSAGVVVSTREPAQLRSFLIRAGASQLSAASRTNPGGYAGKGDALEQFSTNDKRTLHEVLSSVADEGFLPSLCTTCYRVGRVGRDFTEKTIAGEMNKFCQANAILTLKEYSLDQRGNGNGASLTTVDKTIASSIDEVKDPAIKKTLLEKLQELEKGKRDLFF